MTEKEKEIILAMQYYKDNGIDCYHDDGSVYLKIPVGSSDETIDVQISNSEISYRSILNSKGEN